MTDCNFPTQCNFPNCFCTGLKRKTDTDQRNTDGMDCPKCGMPTTQTFGINKDVNWNETIEALQPSDVQSADTI